MKILKSSTYKRLLESRAVAIAESSEWVKKFAEMVIRKDYLKGEFTRVSILLDECKEQLKRTSIGLERTLNNEEKAMAQLLESQDQCMRLATGLAKSFSIEEILKKQLTAAQKEIRKLTVNTKEKK